MSDGSIQQLEASVQLGEQLMQLFQQANDAISSIIATAGEAGIHVGPHINEALTDIQRNLHEIQDRYSQTHAELQAAQSSAPADPGSTENPPNPY